MNNGPKQNKLISLLIFLIPLVFIYSCSSSSYSIPDVQIKLVVEYSNTNVQTSRLSVICETTNDSRRFSTMTIHSAENNFFWSSQDLVKLKQSEKMYTGCTNFIMPENKPFPQGEYSVKLISYDENEIEVKKDFFYDSFFLGKTADEIHGYMVSVNAAHFISVYNNEDELIFHGEFLPEYEDNKRQIWNRFPKAAYYNEIWILPDQSVMCILKNEEIIPENQN